MTQLDKVLYTAQTHTTGGRDGASRSSDGRLDIKLTSPGAAGSGTNPEQLFAAGWSACFIGAMGVAARKMKVTLPPNAAVVAEVDLGTNEGGYLLRRASTSASRVWNTKSPGQWWTRHIKRAPTPKPRAATSTSKSTWLELNHWTDLLAECGQVIGTGVHLSGSRCQYLGEFKSRQLSLCILRDASYCE